MEAIREHLAKKVCFVIVPMSDTKSATKEEWEDIFISTIKPAVENSGLNYECQRIGPQPGNIVKGIMQGLARGDVVVADLTDDKANVFYELGVRHALRRGTILLSQNLKEVPFDLKNYYAVEYGWKTTAERQKLARDLKDQLRNWEREPNKDDSPVADFLRREGLTVTPSSPHGMPVWANIERRSPDFGSVFLKNHALGVSLSAWVPAAAPGLQQYQSGCNFAATRGILNLGQPTEAAIAVLPFSSRDLAVETELRIPQQDAARKDPSRWVGLRLRGFSWLGTEQNRDGHLVYLRCNGQLEVYNPRGIPHSLFSIAYPVHNWVKIRMILQDRKIQVDASSDHGKKLGEGGADDLEWVGNGHVALHSHYIASQFKMLRMWRLP